MKDQENKRISLAISNPELSRQWHPTLNGELTPDDVTKGSNKKRWWLCGNGHEWEARVYSRNKGSGCPYCAGFYAHSGNSLKTIYPFLSKQWHPTKNGDRNPDNVTSKSDIKAWWLCEKGHPSYESKVYNRALGKGCPVCSIETRTSFPEQAFFFYFKTYFKDTINGFKYDRKWEIDIYIPSLKIGIEYDGVHFHRNNHIRDNEKEKYLKSSGIRLLRVKELEKRNSRLQSIVDGDVIFISNTP